MNVNTSDRFHCMKVILTLSFNDKYKKGQNIPYVSNRRQLLDIYKTNYLK